MATLLAIMDSDDKSPIIDLTVKNDNQWTARGSGRIEPMDSQRSYGLSAQHPPKFQPQPLSIQNAKSD